MEHISFMIEKDVLDLILPIESNIIFMSGYDDEREDNGYEDY